MNLEHNSQEILPDRMSLKEFKDYGYLREVNRRFFHPLNMAMAFIVDDDDEIEFGFIGKYPEGVSFDTSGDDALKQGHYLQIAQRIENEMREVQEVKGLKPRSNRSFKKLTFIENLKVCWKILTKNNFYKNGDMYRF